MSSTIIGGNLKCYHGIDTSDIDEWNAHCSDPANGHTESGITQCVDCKTSIVFEGIPYHPITPTGKNIQLRCPGCFENYTNVNNQNLVKVANPEEGIRMSEPKPVSDNAITDPEIQDVVQPQLEQNIPPKITSRGKLL